MYPSLFNDVFGPIMTAASGSACAAVREIDGFPVDGIKGEEYVLLIQHRSGPCFVQQLMAAMDECCSSLPSRILNIRTFRHPRETDREMLAVFLETGNVDLSFFSRMPGVEKLRMLEPIMPVVTRKGARPPLFTSVRELTELAEREGVDCSEIAILYEMGRALKPRDEIVAMMARVWEILRGAGKNGNCVDGPSAVGPFAEYLPVLAGALLSAAEERGLGDEAIIRALFTAAAIGAVSCRKDIPIGEAGIGSAMAAGAVVTLAGGEPRHVEAAASIALESMPGSLCQNDPAAVIRGALAAAESAMSGSKPAVPFDQAVETAT